MNFLVTAVVAYLVYLLLTIGSGTVFLWSTPELIVGAIFAVVVGAVLRNRFIGKDLRMLNPRRWFTFLVYLFPFFWAMAKANIDVAYRVITGRINPAIVKINPNLKNDMSLTFLANSITLTPGTLSVDVDQKTNELYVHWINPNLKNDMSLTFLANSITLTPGTLSVDVDQKTNELYVHWINVDPEVLKEMPRDYRPICGSFPEWSRRITG